MGTISEKRMFSSRPLPRTWIDIGPELVSRNAGDLFYLVHAQRRHTANQLCLANEVSISSRCFPPLAKDKGTKTTSWSGGEIRNVRR
jgi:hypothetical protein